MNYNSRHEVLSWGHRGHLVTSNKDGRQQNPHDSGQRRLFLTLICTNHPQFVSWEETFLVFVTTIKFRNFLTTWALTSCDLTNFFHGHKNNRLQDVFYNSNKGIVSNMQQLVGRPAWFWKMDYSWLWFAKTTISFVGGNISGFGLCLQDSKFTYYIHGLWQVLIWQIFFTDKKITDCY